MNRLNRLIPLQLHHQIRKAPIRLHQSRLRTHKPIRQLPHRAKKPILKHPLRLIHEIGQLNRKPIHARLIPRNGRNLRHDDRLAVAGVHALQVSDARIAVGAVVMQTEIIRWVSGNEMHPFFEPALAGGVVGDGRGDEFFPPVGAQGYHLGVPGLGGALGGDVVLVGLVEEVDDGFVAVEDVLPVLAGELGFEVDHGAEGGAGVEFGRDPGVPVAEGGEGAVEVALV